MSDTLDARRRPRPRKSIWPWDDKAGRFSSLKATALALQAAPGVYLAGAWLASALGPRPVLELIHGTGLWAIRLLLLSLAISPLRALLNWPRLLLIRRQVGLSALFYALAHLTLYALDQKWALLHVASEIALRFYLTIGFVALLGLAALGVTSTDAMVQRLGRRWKRLHRIAYALAGLVAFHYVLQSKSDVSEATLMAGVLIWLLGWRLLPAGADRAPLPVLALGVVAALLTAGLEFAWFALGTKIDPMKPLLAELDWSFGPHPAGQVLVLGLCMAVATALAWAAQRERWRARLMYDVALYAGGAAMAAGVAFTFMLTDAWLPDDWTVWQAAGMFIAGAGALGVARWAVPPGRLALDVLLLLGLAAPVVAGLVL